MPTLASPYVKNNKKISKVPFFGTLAGETTLQVVSDHIFEENKYYDVNSQSRCDSPGDRIAGPRRLRADTRHGNRHTDDRHRDACGDSDHADDSHRRDDTCSQEAS
jgi:hypothetical protein